jgi:succinyl-CoA synthetase beta subunit
MMSDFPMDLLEYQAKDLFRGVGIPVLPAQLIQRPRDIKGLTIPYPVVLKSQVLMGGRAREGGIRFVENTIDAMAAAQAMFNLPMGGEYPMTLLAEARYDVEREFYLAVVLNQSIRRPMLLGSMEGGVDVQTAKGQMQQVVVEGEFSPFYARRLALNMGLSGPLMNAVSDVLERMYWLFFEKDLDLVEINPLAVNAAGGVMALDGKITVNDGALGRHGDLVKLRDGDGLVADRPLLQMTLDVQGPIGILCNGSGLTMATMDLVYQAGGLPSCLFNMGSDTHYDWDEATFCDRLKQGLAEIAAQGVVQVVLVNVMAGVVAGEAISEAVLSVLKGEASNVRSLTVQESGPSSVVYPLMPQIVLRALGAEGFALSSLANHPHVTVVESLELAIDQTVKLAASL